jgi:hypothetical protein
MDRIEEKKPIKKKRKKAQALGRGWPKHAGVE